MCERLNQSTWSATALALLLLASTTFAGQIIYVDADATGANDGSSWADAYKYLQDALPDAGSADKPVEIRVAQGIYRPDRNAAEPNGTGDRTATFQLINGVTLEGGYAGLSEPDPNARDTKLHETILSGDLDGDDTDAYDPGDSWYDRMWNDNSYHVVTVSEANESAVLDGFQITSGYCVGPPPIVFEAPAYYGGGMVIIAASPTVIDCTFAGNAVTVGGGALANLEGSSPTLVDCRFERNYSAWRGGGISNSDSVLTLIECRFYRNLAGSGGAISCTADGLLDLHGCSFVQNAARHSGAAINAPSIDGKISPEVVKETCFVRLENCAFTGNKVDSVSSLACRAVVCGAAWLTSCTFSGNRVRCGIVAGDGTLLENCIIWGNFTNDVPCIPDMRRGPFEHGLTYHCCIQDSSFHPAGHENIHSDPCFAHPGYWDPNGTPDDPNDDFWVEGDYHLKSQAGRWDPVSQSWVQDDVTSPCTDAGDPSIPIGLEPFPNGGVVNMGAYGGTAEASKSYFGEPVCQTIIAGDINGDCKVDFGDFALMAAHWLEDNQ